MLNFSTTERNAFRRWHAADSDDASHILDSMQNGTLRLDQVCTYALLSLKKSHLNSSEVDTILRVLLKNVYWEPGMVHLTPVHHISKLLDLYPHLTSYITTAIEPALLYLSAADSQLPARTWETVGHKIIATAPFSLHLMAEQHRWDVVVRSLQSYEFTFKNLHQAFPKQDDQNEDWLLRLLLMHGLVAFASGEPSRDEYETATEILVATVYDQNMADLPVRSHMQAVI